MVRSVVRPVTIMVQGWKWEPKCCTNTIMFFYVHLGIRAEHQRGREAWLALRFWTGELFDVVSDFILQ